MDYRREFIVESRDLSERASIRRIGIERMEFRAQRIVHGDADIVDGRLWILVELLVHADGIWELDRWESREVRDDGVCYAWDIASITLEDLSSVSKREMYCALSSTLTCIRSSSH